MNQEYNRDLAGILESTEDAIISKSFDGTIQSWNKGSEKMFGYTSKEIIGQNISLIIPPEFIKDDKNNLRRISNKEIVDRYESTRITKKGEQLFVSLIVSDIKDKVGNITGSYEVARDITSKKKSEAELIEAYIELALQNEEKEKRAAELLIANKELAFQNEEKEKRAAELLIANKELAFQNEEKEKRAAELLIANKELAFQNEEKEKRAAELLIANKELAFQNEEKEKRAAELLITKKELAFQKVEKEKWANELIISIEELAFQKKEKRAAELLIANKELDFFNEDQQALFASIVNSSEDAMLSKNLDLIITSWNHGAEKIFGYKANEIIGKSVLMLIPPQLQQEEIDLTKKIMAGETVDNYKTLRLRKDGTVFNAMLILSPIKNFKGIIIGTSKVLRDITEQEILEINLSVIRKEIEDYKFALDQSSIVAITDQKGIIKYANNNYLNISKYSREELIGQDHRIICSRYHSSSFIKNLWVTIANGKIWKGELKNKAKDGSTYWVDTTIVPFLDKEGKPYQYMAIRTDITERKNAEEKIIEIKKRFKSLIENSLDGITLTDQFFNDIYRSPGSQKITSILSTENTFGSKHPDDLNLLKNIHARVLSCPDIPVPFQGRFREESGKYIWLEGTFTNLLHVDGVNAIVANYRDVSNRKKLEDLLQKANMLARLGGWELDLLKGTVYWSDITREIHEAESSFVPDLATGINFYQAGHDRDLITQKVKEAIELGKPWDEELQIVTAKNNLRWIRTIGETEFIDDKCVRIYGSFQDIDERKKGEEDKMRLTERLLLATQSAQLGIWDWDIKNNVLKWDEGMYRLYNISANEFTSVLEGWFSRLHQEDRQPVQNELELALANKKDYNPEFRIVWVDSSVHYISASGIIERDNDGNAIRMIGANWDITAQKEKEQHLKLLESVITNTTDSVLITEAEPIGQPEPRILYVNDAFTKMTGYTAEEVIGKTTRILQGPKSDRAELERLSKAIRRWESCEITTITYKKNGEEFWINFTLTPVANEKGWFTHWIYIERDVSDRKLAEFQLNELNKNLQNYANNLTFLNAELEQFAFVASHDLQEPLRMITSFLMLLEKKYGDRIDGKGKQYIGFAVDGAKRMRQIILDLLEYSRVGIKEDEKEELDLNKLIDEIKILLRITIKEKEAIIIIDELPKIQAYLSPMRQVFQNLINNALKYSNKGIPAQIHIAVEELKDYWQFAVIDNGIGIEKEYLEKIFIIFQRLHTKEEYPGTGMGLAIVKKIIEMQGGKIWVESEEGKGSIFYFTIKK